MRLIRECVPYTWTAVTSRGDQAGQRAPQGRSWDRGGHSLTARDSGQERKTRF